MDFKVNRPSNPRDRRNFIAVPSTENGVFVINHGDYYGRRVYRDMELKVPDDELDQALAGDFSGSYERLQPHPEEAGVFTPAPWMLEVAITLPGSGNTVSHNVSVVEEMMPFVAAPIEQSVNA